MLRVSCVSRKISGRSWTGSKKPAGSAAAHFPKTAFVDPALQRGSSGTSAKETKVFRLDDAEGTQTAGHGRQGAALERNYRFKKLWIRASQWAHITGISDPLPTVLATIPAFWGAGFAVTRLLVWDGADPVVLCAPLIPVHLLVFFPAAALLLRGGCSLAQHVIHQCRSPSTVDDASQEENVPIAEAGGLLGAHVVIGAITVLNLAPVAAAWAVASLPLLALSNVMDGNRKLRERAIALSSTSLPQHAGVLARCRHALPMWLSGRAPLWLQCAACGGVPAMVGYAAVAGHVHAAVGVPLFLGSTLWSMFHTTLKGIASCRDAERVERERHLVQMTTMSLPLRQHGKGPSAAAASNAVIAAALDPIITAPSRSNSSGWRQPQQTSGGSSSFVASPSLDFWYQSLTPQLLGDLKGYWTAVLIVPSVCLIVAAGMLSSQCLLFYLGVIGSLLYIVGVADHANVFDGWSCRLNYKRNIRFGFFIMISIACSNAFWGLATEHEATKDKEDSQAPSTLHRVLRLSIDKNARVYDASEFNWTDRFARPAWVQTHVLLGLGPSGAAMRESMDNAAVSDADMISGQATLPPWMRREYLGQNTAAIARWTGFFSDDTIDWALASWYRNLDHYNVFTKIVI